MSGLLLRYAAHQSCRVDEMMVWLAADSKRIIVLGGMSLQSVKMVPAGSPVMFFLVHRRLSVKTVKAASGTNVLILATAQL